MQPPFNIVVKILEGEREIYLNTEQAARIEIYRKTLFRNLAPEVIIFMVSGETYKLTDTQAQAFIDRVDGR